MDNIDKEIVLLLQEDAKMNVKKIAEKLNITISPVYDRIKRLEENGVIDKYVAITNEKLFGNAMFVFCSVSLEVQKLSEIEKFKSEIMKIPEVMECYLMGGVNDFLLKVRVKDLSDYHKFSSGKLAALNNVSQIKSSFVLDVVKREFRSNTF